MKTSAIAAIFAVLGITAVWAVTGFWVIKDTRAAGCSIVTSNPVINGPIGPILWGSGPYQSEDDAKIAIKTIPSCGN